MRHTVLYQRRKTASDCTQMEQSETAIRADLAQFFAEHPSSALVEIAAVPGGPRRAISKPWDDDSFVILVPNDRTQLAEALNNTRLPARFSGLWHRDTRRFEILWTAFSPRVEQVSNRRFRFTWRGTERECRFARTSERALVIAANFQMIGQSTSDYRNLLSFNMWSQHESVSSTSEPLSFWIDDIDWDENAALDLALHLRKL
jgi:hypothetical protein